jgi:tellurium resistance protein TerD
MFELDLKKSAAEGFTLDLSKEHPTLTKLTIVTSWKEHPIHAASLTDGYDIDQVGFFLNTSGKVKVPEDVLYFGNKTVYNGAGQLPNDNRTGGDETIYFDYSKVPADRSQIDHYIVIYEAIKRNQTFLMMTDGKVVLSDGDTNKQIGAFKLNDYTNDNALHIGSSVRTANGWEFKPVGKSAHVADLNEILRYYF